MTLGIEILILLSPDGFEERFYFYAKTEKTYLKAYEKTELEYQNYFGKNKYSNYDSFRVVMQRKIKNKK
jgi:hypothetical protein